MGHRIVLLCTTLVVVTVAGTACAGTARTAGTTTRPTTTVAASSSTSTSATTSRPLGAGDISPDAFRLRQSHVEAAAKGCAKSDLPCAKRVVADFELLASQRDHANSVAGGMPDDAATTDVAYLQCFGREVGNSLSRSDLEFYLTGLIAQGSPDNTGALLEARVKASTTCASPTAPPYP